MFENIKKLGSNSVKVCVKAVEQGDKLLELSSKSLDQLLKEAELFLEESDKSREERRKLLQKKRMTKYTTLNEEIDKEFIRVKREANSFYVTLSNQEREWLKEFNRIETPELEEVKKEQKEEKQEQGETEVRIDLGRQDL